MIARESAGEVVSDILQKLSNIQLTNTSKDLSAACLLEAVKYLLDIVEGHFEYPDLASIDVTSETSPYILKHINKAKLYAEHLRPLEVEPYKAKDLKYDFRNYNIKMILVDGGLWVEDWFKSAYQHYDYNGGYAGLSFKKYISKMRPSAETTATNKKRIFKHQKIDGEDTVDDETLFNVKRKVRQKAPRLKNRMGRG